MTENVSLNVILILVFSLISIILLLVLLIGSKRRNKDSETLMTEVSSLKKSLEQLAYSVRSDSEALRREVNEDLNYMSERIENMSARNYDVLLKLNSDVNSSLREINTNSAAQSEKQNEILMSSILKMQESNEKKLDQMRETVDEKLSATLSSRLDSSFKTVSEQLENVYRSLGEMKELSGGVTTNISALNRVLTNVKARGTWAEIQLEGILDQTIPNMYVKNYSPEPGSRDVVEFAVKIPSSDGSGNTVYLPLDSKFPLEDYRRLCEAADSGDRDNVIKARKALEERVLGEAKKIRKYINVPSTTPFAVMYLATEGLYAEIASSSSGIMDRLQREGIMPAGPTTVIALLNTLSMGFKTAAINEKANEVRVLLSATKAQYEKFGAVLEKAGRKIDEAGRTLSEAKSRNDIIQKKLRSIEQADYGESDMILGIEYEDNEDNDA